MTNNDEMIISRRQLDAVEQLIEKYTAYADNMRRQYSELEKDNRYQDRKDDSAVRADCYCEWFMIMERLSKSAGDLMHEEV